MSRAWCISKSGLLLDLHVQPNAKRSEWAGYHGDRLKIRLASPPVDGQANRELVRFLSRQLAVAKSAIDIVSGAASRRKRVAIQTDEQTARRLAHQIDEDSAA